MSRRRKTKSCKGKRRFHDHTEAVRALHLVSTSERDTVPCRCYECPTCRGWHLTSQAYRGAAS